jgi:hypothetical protein
MATDRPRTLLITLVFEDDGDATEQLMAQLHVPPPWVCWQRSGEVRQGRRILLHLDLKRPPLPETRR